MNMDFPNDNVLVITDKGDIDESPIISTVNGSHSPTHFSSNKGNPPKNRKQAFNRSFKQAVFMKRGNEDGSSQLHVSFTTSSKQLGSSGNTAQKPKAKPALLHKDIVTIDKRKMQEEIDSLPKPEHLVEAEKELLDMKGVLVFKPRTPDMANHPCKGCFDCFPTIYTLQDHLERQSYSLSLNCPECHKKLHFTNKCAMYTHLVTHYPVDIQQCCYVAQSSSSISVLPRNQLRMTNVAPKLEQQVNGDVSTLENPMEDSKEGLKKVLVPEPDIGEPSAIVGNGHCALNSGEHEAAENSAVVNSELSQPETSEELILPEESEPEENDVSWVTCTECSKNFESVWALETHFSVPEDARQIPKYCLSCRVELHTPCSYKAHMRLHGIEEPYTCPDCGIKFSKKNIFLKHVRLKCLHYSKLSEYLCPGCPETFCYPEEQLKHLQSHSQHLRFEGERSYYKCNGCPKAFKSVAAHSKHDSCPGAGCTVVHMCNNCPQQTVFRSWPELIEHRAQAHPDLKWIPKRSRIYSCYLCSHKTKSKQGFYDHLLKVHGKTKIDYMCSDCGAELESMHTLGIHQGSCPTKRRLKNGTVVLQESAQISPKLSVSSTASNASCSNASQSNLTEESQATQQPQHSDVHYLTYSPSFDCHMCTAPFSDYSQLREHVKRRHEGRGMIYECWLCRDRGNTGSFYRQSALDKHMLDVHKIQLPSTESTDTVESEDHDTYDEPPLKRLKLWNNTDQPYQCCRCEFHTLSGDDFREHIKEHKSANDAYQCAECGMCFPVQIALKRHLFAVHKVTDYVKYSRIQYMTEYEKQLHNSQGKCPVCSKEFGEPAQLRKHLRTHGMVYINTKRVPNC